ncbi:hypothetical protein [Rhodococcus marinonascens]|uniref:hypothetical protein n=1 Tax=Rhodococcus marinonascens TaxID=38311 RepID=UPI000933E6F0|nr:hypothetical protein [Rhodococcus marinonascens]
MDDRTVAIGALAVATFSVVFGLTIGATSGAFGIPGPPVLPPPITSEGLQAADPYIAETTTSQVFVPPTPTWRMADLTTPRAVPPTTRPIPVTTAPQPTLTSTLPVTTVLPVTTTSTSTPAITTTRPVITIPPLTTRPRG